MCAGCVCQERMGEGEIGCVGVRNGGLWVVIVWLGGGEGEVGCRNGHCG